MDSCTQEVSMNALHRNVARWNPLIHVIVMECVCAREQHRLKPQGLLPATLRRAASCGGKHATIMKECVVNI